MLSYLCSYLLKGNSVGWWCVKSFTETTFLKPYSAAWCRVQQYTKQESVLASWWQLVCNHCARTHTTVYTSWEPIINTRLSVHTTKSTRSLLALDMCGGTAVYHMLRIYLHRRSQFLALEYATEPCASGQSAYPEFCSNSLLWLLPCNLHHQEHVDTHLLASWSAKRVSESDGTYRLRW